VLCAIVFFASATAHNAQTTPDPAITALSVMGIVTDLKADTRQVIVTTAAGNQVTVTLGDRTVFMRIPPGEKTKDKFIKIAPTDFAPGDSVFARGRMSEDRKSMPALEFYVMSKGDIAEKRERERGEWSKRGISGTISAINAETKEISVDARTAEGPKPIVVPATAETKFRRYAPDSVRFDDAKSGTFADLKVGDQLRALGTKSADGARFTPEEIVTGSFQTITGTITEVDAEKKEIKIKDLQSQQPVTIALSNDSSLRQLTPEMVAALSPAPAAKPDAAAKPAAKGSSDLQEMFDQLPTFTLQELKPGDSILISSTKGADPTRVTAIAVVSGVGPLLQNSQTRRATAVSLGAMSLGGP
jgi:antitoxin (DNA-binding transcriptional repressor) of toxin-antitoxin stability system/preprotein translocase subunit YajC